MLTSHYSLVDLIQAVFNSAGDEVAYLALTGNSEGALRDRVALHLHGLPLLSLRGWRVARELRPHRVDLAILGKSGPIAAFELKSGYSYDVLNTRKWSELCIKLKLDLEKCRGLFHAYPDLVEAYSLLFVAHPTAIIPQDLEVIAGKYRRHIEAFAHLDPVDVGAQIVAKIRESFPEAQRLEVGTLRGTAFDIPVFGFWFGIPAARVGLG